MMERTSPPEHIVAGRLATAPKAWAAHLQRHPVPYALAGAGILSVIWFASKRTSSRCATPAEERGASAPTVSSEATSSAGHRRSPQKAATETQDRRTKKFTSEEFPEVASAWEAESVPNGKRTEHHDTSLKTWAEHRRASFLRTRERLTQNRSALEKQYVDSFQKTPLRFGVLSAIIGGLVGIMLPLSLRERALWRPLGQRFWQKAQTWSEHELQKWDAAIDAHIETPPP